MNFRQSGVRIGLRLTLVLGVMLLLLVNLSGSAIAHNLDASAVYVYFDPDTQAMLDARIEAPTWTPPTPLLLNGDALGLIIKITPDNGTRTGVGGYTTFYVPNGLQVLDAAYIMPGSDPSDGITGYDKIPMNGQAQMPAQGVGGDPPISLVGIVRGPNILGVTSPIVTAANTNLGTTVGVYADTGIFYSTAPETAYGSYTGAPQSLRNNSGDIVGLRTSLQNPLNLWDAWQLAAFGISSTSNPLFPGSPLLDSNGRGYAPWGLANAVAGPQSGYAWGFNYAVYSACDPTPTTTPLAACVDTATQSFGPWQRIKYPGSLISNDPPGNNPPVQPYTSGADGSNVGFDLTAGDLPQTTGQNNGTPNAVRWAVGQLTLNVPQWVWLKVKVHDNTAILDPNGCPVWRVDTFGGDAGGDSGGKDHIWRYYDPNSVVFSGCLGIGKPANKEVVKVGDTFQYQVKLYNAGANDLLNVVVRDTLPNGVSFVSAVPAANSGPNPLQWNVGTLLRGQKFESTVTVTASGSGVLVNNITATGVTPDGDPVASSATEKTVSGNVPLLTYDKSVSPTNVAPGASVQYSITIDNIGSGASGSPVVITEYLPTGFTYVGPLVSAIINGANVTGSTTVNATNPAQPVFSVPQAINAGQALVLKFNAQVSATAVPGPYCNRFMVTQGGVNQTTGSQACVTVGGGRIGDTIYRDWDGDGVQDPQDEGMAGVTVNLYAGACPPGGAPIQTKTTDANGQYLFAGLSAGNYCVDVPAPGSGGVPSGYTLTTANDPTTVALATDEQRLNVDFGYKPGGAGAIGDQVFSDVGNDGVFNAGTDVGIPGVTVNLYEDTNGNGVIDAGDALIATDVTDANGVYGFTGLDTSRSYLVKAVDGPGSPVDSFFADPYVSSTGNPVAVTPADFTASDGNVTDADLGYFGLTPATINGAVCLNADADQDCNVADGDSFLPFVTVTLYKDVNGDGQLDSGDLLLQTAVTAADGTYSFADLGPGDYVVSVDATDPDIPGGYFPQTTTVAVDNLAAGQTRNDVDFPFVTLLSKQVSATSANPGDPLTFTITPNYPGDELLSNVKITDPLPAGVNFVNAGQGGVFGPYVPVAGTPGRDSIEGPTTVVTLAPTQDTYIYANSPTRNFGSCTTLEINRQGAYVLLQFNLSGIPAGVVINSADLTLRKTGGSLTALNTEAYRLTTAWTEGTLCNVVGTPNWTDPWVIDGGDWVDADGAAQGAAPYASTAVTAFGPYTWDLAQMTQEWVKGAANRGVILKSLEVGGGLVHSYDSRESVTPANRPSLTVSYTSYDYTKTTLTPGASTAAIGQPIQVTMLLTATQSIANVTPTPLTVSGGAAVCSGPAEPTPANVGPGGTTFTYTCTPSAAGEYIFSGSASSAGGYNFVTATSSSVYVTVDGSASVITWNLGSNEPGVPGFFSASGTLPGLFAFRGGGTLNFWRYETLANAWVPKANALGVVGVGGALTYDGTNIFGLEGNKTKVFWRYDIATNSWTARASTPVAVGAGGALTTLGGNIYAFQGANKPAFWRYNIAGNSWAVMASAPANVFNGGALTNDGTNVYGLRANKTTAFWRYNVASNTWTTLAPTPGAVGLGGALTRVGNFIYALRGNGTTSFYRYDLTAGTWSTRAATPAAVTSGGALTTDGTYLYAFQGGSTAFWRYNIATNTWETRASALATTALGGALVFVPGTGSADRETYISVKPTLVTSGNQVQVTMELRSVANVSNVVPGAQTITDISGNGATASCGAPSPASQNVTANVPAFFTWTCTLTAGALPGNLTFARGATGNGGVTFSSATSNSVIVTQPLTFQATVQNPAPVDVVHNTAFILDKSGALPPTDSNTTETALGPSIGDRVWQDLDGDGVQDPGEVGLAGVTVCATDGVTTLCDVTGPDGSYRIFGVGVGTWTVTTDPTTYPTGYQPTTPASVTAVITTPTQFFQTADFGLRPPGDASIGDTVWLDANNDGSVDSGEAGLPNITLRLYKDDGDGIPEPGELVAVTTTDANGNYLFDGLYAGNYLVVVDESSTVVSTLDPSVTATIADSMSLVSGTNPLPVNVPTNSSDITTADFGYNWAGQIGDLTFYDDNANGIYEPGLGEAPAGLVTQVLYYDANGNGVIDGGDSIVGVVETDANGFYLVDNLPPGNYIMDPDEQTVESRSTPGLYMSMITSTDETIAFTLGTGPGQSMTNLDVDSGFVEASRVEGHVFHDVNFSGSMDSGEPGLPFVVVTLSGTDFNGNPILLTTTTDADGEYVFIIPPGDYTITYDNGAIPPDLTVLTTAAALQFNVIGGQEITGLDFGVDNTGIVGDTIYNDVNGNGVQNVGEPGLAGVTVSLYRDVNNNGSYDPGLDAFQATDVTDGSGNYLFEGLSDGQYLVIVDTTTTPTGYTQSGDPDQPGVPCTICNSLGVANVVGGGSDLVEDFGYKPPANSFSISGRVWDDQDAGGSQNGGEPGLPGVTVCLYDSTGTDLLTCVVTNSAGDYTFPGVINGSYIVRVDPDTLPSAAYVQTGDPDAVCPGAGCNGETPVTVNNANVTGKNFGYDERLGSLSGSVCAGDGNGVCGLGEAPLTPITITLIYAGDDGILGTPDDTVTAMATDPSGNYSFTGLLPGLYAVIETNLPGYVSLNDADGGHPDIINAVLAPGDVVIDQDFEDAAPTTPAAIGNSVWIDENANGIQDAGEPGLANVVVELRDSTGTTVIMTTTTDLNGGYVFTDVPPGTYQIQVATASLPAELFSTSLGAPGADGNNQTQPYTVTVAAGDENMTADFGYTWADPADINGNTGNGAIGDRVWIDVNGDGVQDAGEPGLAGATVQLYTDPDGNGIYDTPYGAPVVTGPDGSYIFTNVPPDGYVVGVTPPPGYTPTSGPIDEVIPLAPGDVYLNADFGFQPLVPGGVIGDAIWLDADGDGLQDAGEPGIPGVTVALLDAAGNVIATVTTDANGNYAFTGLPDGTYTVWVNDTNHVLGELAPTFDQDGLGTPNQSTTTIVGGSLDNSQDFGYAPAGQAPGDGLIGDTIYLDRDGSNTPDAGEGLEGVTVYLYDSSGLILLATTTTNENGNYSFGNVPAGTYIVVVDETTLPGGGTGLTNSVDPDGGTAGRATVVLSSGEVDLAQDFGYSADNPGAVAGTVWEDINANGAQDEPLPATGLGGVTIALYTDVNGDGLIGPEDTLVATTVTDANGDYSFDNLPPGDYIVDVTDTAGVLDGYWHSLGVDSDPDPSGVTVVSGATQDVDFGYHIEPAALGDRVWVDADGDGIQDAGEANLPGVTVILVITYPDGSVITLTKVTDNNGYYDFSNLLLDEAFNGIGAGEPSFSLTFVPPTGYTPSPVGVGGDPSADSNGLVDTPTPIQGQNDATYDSGFIAAPTPGTIGNSVWIDENANGVQDAGEPGLPNVVVELYDSMAVLIGTTVTDLNGHYLFSDVPAGSYWVQVDVTSLPAGLFVSTLGTPGADENNQAQPYSVTVNPGVENMTADFGYTWANPSDINGNTGNGAIGDRVWIDADGDGVQDPGEPGLPGATVQLYTDPDGDGVYNTPFGAPVITGPDGSYIFTNVPPGGYVVGVTPPAGYAPTGGPIGEVIPLAPGDVYLNADFGFQPTGPAGTIGDTVWFDANANGTLDGNEYGIPGVTVALLDSGGNVIATTTTDANGNYSFPGLPDGTYTVWVNDTNHVLGEVTPTFDDDGTGTPNTSTTTIAGGAPDNNQDFGYAPPGQQPGEGLIGDTLYLDRDGNRAPGPGEGLEGVTVNLLDSLGNVIATTTTDENGHYAFGNLPDGNYTVQVDVSTLPGGGAGLTNSLDPDGGLANESDVTITGGNVNLDQDFGYTADNPGAIAGTIWEDTNADGALTEAGNGLAGVTVALYVDSNGDGLIGLEDTLVATTVTNANGDYSFDNLPPGDYIVDVTDTAGVLDGYWHSLGVDSESDPTGVTVVSGATQNADFGYYVEPAALGNRVWDDLDKDGVQDIGENGMPGVEVTLRITYPNGTVVTLVTVTGPTGLYSFDNLLLDEDFDGAGAGEPQYLVTFATPPNTTPSPIGQGGDPAQDSNGVTDTPTLAKGTVNDTVDSGFIANPTAVSLRSVGVESAESLLLTLPGLILGGATLYTVARRRTLRR